MNLILLDSDDFIDDNHVRIKGRRFDHVVTILGKGCGESVHIGQINGLMGRGVITALDNNALVLEIHLQEQAPPPLPVTLMLALPRPKMLRRILRAVSSMGIKSIYLINSYRVDKSYWNSPLLQPPKLREQLCLGMEQGRDTLMPQVFLRPRFRPFVEDELPAICATTTNLVAHPGAGSATLLIPQVPACLAVGPEGGFIPYEIDRLGALHFNPVRLGRRILSVETAVPALVSRFIGESL